MPRWKINYLVDLLLFLNFIFLAVSGLIPWLFLPRGRYAPRGVSPDLIFSRQDWLQIHRWSALVFLFLVIIHLCLHWDWIVKMTRCLLSPREKECPRE